MGMYRPIDYHRWAPHLDFASWDNYPPLDASPTRMALAHDLMRGLKDGAAVLADGADPVAPPPAATSTRSSGPA